MRPDAVSRREPLAGRELSCVVYAYETIEIMSKISIRIYRRCRCFGSEILNSIYLNHQFFTVRYC